MRVILAAQTDQKATWLAATVTEVIVCEALHLSELTPTYCKALVICVISLPCRHPFLGIVGWYYNIDT